MARPASYGPARPPGEDAGTGAAGEEEAGEQLPCKEAAVLTGHEGPVLAVRFNAAGTYCLTCGKDRTLRLWNPHRGVLVKTYAGHAYDVRDVAASDDNSKLASVGGDRAVFLWDVTSGRVIRKFRGHDGVVNSVCFGAGNEVLVTGGYDQAVRLWDCRSRSFEALQTIKPFGDAVMSVTAHGTEIIAGSVDGTVRRFDVRAGAMFVDELAAPVTCVALSHDGNCLLAAGCDSRLRLLDKASGELLAEYTGHAHASAKLDCCLTPSDAHVVAGSEDGRVCYWDLVEGTLVHSFLAHKGVVCSLAMHPGGACLLSAGTDGCVRVWTP